MNDREIDGIYKANYHKVLDILRYPKVTEPEVYKSMAKAMNEYRDWVIDVSGLRTLPIIPEE